MRSLLMVCGLIILSGLAVAGNDFETGLAAYERQEYSKALEILQPLAIAGDADAQNLLGKMYGFGQGGAKDGKEAAKWFMQAARNGNRESQEIIAVEAIGEFHETGDIIGDKIETIDWIMSLAKRGNSEAMNMIGILYHTGKVLPTSTIEAEKWYCRAIKAGNQSAARNLGLMMAGTIYYLERVKKVGDKLPKPCPDRG